MKPDFVIIGAQKAGTTALMRYLAEHPEIHLPRGETRYFRDPWFQMESPAVLDVAAATDDPRVLRRGIKCPDLLAPPEAPGRLIDALGMVDLIAVLRDPVARAISAYFWYVQYGWLPIEDPEIGLAKVLDGDYEHEHPRATEILDFGRYGAHLTRYLTHFPREKLFILLDGDLRAGIAGASKSLFAFLDVDTNVELTVPRRRVNPGVYSPTRLRLLQRRNRYIVREFPGYEYAGRFLQLPVGVRARVVDRAIAALDRVVLARVCDNSKPQISDALRHRLHAYYRDDIAALSALLDRDLSAWTVPYEAHSVTWSAGHRVEAEVEGTAPPVHKRARTRLRYFPETALDDFSRMDSAVEFYTRVNALVRPEMTVVDFGAGRGQWYVDATSETRRRLRDFRGKTARVIGLDVDPVVASNPSVDEAHLIEIGGALPLPDASVDLVVSDFTFEHIDDPDHVAAEFDRILRPGGWICARTPNKWGYIGIGARAVPNRWHVSWLTRLQPGRKDIDVFPVRYRLNTRRDLAKHFPPNRFEQVTYTVPGEPSYAGGSRLAWAVMGFLQRFQPRVTQPVLLIFLRKRA